MLTSPASLRAALSVHTPVRTSIGRKAAVLIPIYFAPEGPRVLFMKRPDGDSAHAGQVSFPGGRVEPDDHDEEQAALREAEEELGIAHSIVEIIGRLDDFNTVVTDYDVTPVVGVLTQEPEIKPSAAEVADHFWVPLAALARADAWRGQAVTRNDKTYQIWFYDDAPYVIWGATAAMLRQFLEWTCDMH